MGKASKWFRSILGLKKIDSKHQPPPPSSKQPHKDKRRWSFVKSYREKDSAIPNNKPAAPKPNSSSDTFARQQQLQKDSVSAGGCEVEDPDKHAMAVAAATAAVAEAAVAAAQAAAAVVRLTSSSRRCAREEAAVSSCELSEELAAVRIQSAFRGYLARRASRALKGLVRLQALVRGHIERKKTAERLRWMLAMLRAQARARAGRAQISESSQSSSKSSQFHHHGPPTPENFEYATRSKSSKYEKSSMLKRNGSKSSGRTLDNHGWNRSNRQIDEQTWDQSDKILEIDTVKPHSKSKHRNLFHSTPLVFHSDLYSCSFTNSRESQHTGPSPCSGELKFADEVEESPFCTADNSPQFYSASSIGGSSRRSPFSCRSYLSGYSDHPNYMSNTESSRAKARSLSAPKQRPQFERSSSTKRHSIHGLGELNSNTYKPSLHANFVSKAYPGSGRLDRLGKPVGYRY